MALVLGGIAMLMAYGSSVTNRAFSLFALAGIIGPGKPEASILAFTAFALVIACVVGTISVIGEDATSRILDTPWLVALWGIAWLFFLAKAYVPKWRRQDLE